MEVEPGGTYCFMTLCRIASQVSLAPANRPGVVGSCEGGYIGVAPRNATTGTAPHTGLPELLLLPMQQPPLLPLQVPPAQAKQRGDFLPIQFEYWGTNHTVSWWTLDRFD